MATCCLTDNLLCHMTTALVVGKFLPPHVGHALLIDHALTLADTVHVFVNDRPAYVIPAEVRAAWVQQAFPATRVHVANDPWGDNDSAGQAANIKRILGFVPDIIVTSEDWADPVCDILGSRHVRVDPERVALPISATMLREDPVKHWDMLLPQAKAGLCHRIVLVGSESTGKTTLAQALAKRWNTTWVPEYGREYTEEKVANATNDHWVTGDFVVIADRQQQLEDHLALNSGPILVCDTDAFATAIWHERYEGERSPAVEAIAARRHYTLYVLAGLDVPWVKDNIRDGLKIRQWMHERFITELNARPEPWFEVTGSVDQRIALVEAEIARCQLLSAEAIFDPLRWK
jgi:HTH-type transcriptional regulator, transcriptional repressor of NAD biosynthesis genes